MICQFTAAGARHVREGIENQDAAVVTENEHYAVAVLADGVSTCSQAQRGAQLACNTAARLLMGRPDYFMSATHEEIVCIILRNVLYALEKAANEAGLDAVEYSSTLSFALYSRKEGKTLLFQLGDGLILGSLEEACFTLVQPGESRNGTCVTTTKNAGVQCVTCFVSDRETESIMLLTDGAWRILESGGVIRPDATQAFCNGEYEALQALLRRACPQDDYTMLIMTTP